MKTEEKEEMKLPDINNLSFFARALTMNPAVTVSFSETGECHVDMKSCRIEIPKTEDIEVAQGFICHEAAHVLFSELLQDELNKLTNENDRKDLHMQLNSLEDFRIEYWLPNKCYPDADYLLWKQRRYLLTKILPERSLKTMTTHPSYVLHCLIAGIDLTRFIENPECRKAIRYLHKKFMDTKFWERGTTREIFPLALEAYETLKPYYPRPSSSKSKEERSEAINIGEEARKLLDHYSPDGPPIFINASEATVSTIKPTTEPKKSAEDTCMVEAEIDMPTKPLQIKEDYARPYTPAVLVIKEPAEEVISPGIFDETKMEEEGRRIGKELMKQLKIKDSTRKHLLTGKLDMRSVLRNMRKTGHLTCPRVFKRLDAKLQHEHAVTLLIDFSGSMNGRKVQMARSAALLLARALEEMRVPYTVRGFSATSGELQIVDYVLKGFEEYRLDSQKLAAMYCWESHYENRDSDSIRHATKELLSQRGKHLLFVISDGQPAHEDGVKDYRRFDEQCHSDTIAAIQEASVQGVVVVGIGITTEANTFLKKAYPRSLFVQELETLPERLLKLYLAISKDLRK